MKANMTFKFALKNLKANKVFLLPYWLSSGIMMALLFVMSSLSSNEYVKTRHQDLPVVINFGILITAILTFIFVIYGNKFVMKRRNKGFALYGILGLEKRHVIRIILVERIMMYLFTLALAIPAGYIFGKFFFLLLNKLVRNVGTKISDYTFEPKVALYCAIFLLAIYVILLIADSAKIGRLSPMELMEKQESAEGEPKSKLFLGLIGIVSMGLGYYIALTTAGVLESLKMFFVAVLLVILGTYFLFISLSIVVLKRLKKNKKYYYQDRHFLFITGMLYRMKSNAVSLASIAIISTAIIVVLSTTMSAYAGMQETLSTLMNTDYSATYMMPYEEITGKEAIKNQEDKMKEAIDKTLSYNQKATDVKAQESLMLAADLKGNSFEPLNSANLKSIFYLIVIPVDSYNRVMGTDYKCKDGEVLLTSNSRHAKQMSQTVIGGKTYKAKKFDGKVPASIAVEAYIALVPDMKDMLEIAKAYPYVNQETGEKYSAPVNLTISYNLKNDSRTYFGKADAQLGEQGFRVDSREKNKQMIYTLNGGFLFLGIVVGGVFLIGNILMTYYKQVSEGFEDRESFQIMKKVGLPEELIRKTSRNQMIWLFALPLIVAFIHSLGASRLMSKLLFLFGVTSYMTYFGYLGLVALLFGGVYFIVYLITSKIYVKIVS